MDNEDEQRELEQRESEQRRQEEKEKAKIGLVLIIGLLLALLGVNSLLAEVNAVFLLAGCGALVLLWLLFNIPKS